MPAARSVYTVLAILLLSTVIGLLLIALRYNQAFTDTTDWMHHTIVVLNADQDALSALHDYEAGKIGHNLVQDRILRLQQLTADNAFQQERTRKMLLFSASLPDFHTGGLTLRDPNVDRIRTALLEFQGEENSLLKNREAASGQSRRSLKNAIGYLLAAVFTLLSAGLYIAWYNFNRRLKVEKAKQESESLLALLVDHVNDYAIIMLDAEGRVLSWNKGAEQINGYTRDEIIGKPFSLFYTDEEVARGEPERNLQKAAKENRYECIDIRKRKDGSQFHADVIYTALRNEKEELTGFIKITRDITDQIAAQDEINKSLAREIELNAMKSRFVALASHEFKTPLSVILSSTNLIEKYHSPEMAEKRLRHVHRIKSNVNHLKQLLNDFLSLAKLEEGATHNEPAAVNVIGIAEETIQDMDETRKEGQHIEFEITGDPGPVALDPHLLRNILNNLLSNAIKYSPEGSPVRFLLQFEAETVRFQVIDKGIGIPVEEQEQLFDRFFRASNTSGISGTGLGLSIVKRYLDLMGGTIRVESQPGAGSSFTIQLPARREHQPQTIRR
ncbi:MAG TPA: ATP-binding protein [Puia sp.]|uniref:sensor histidine kinase n=1 Tax=Puia sp. TaxID=2045100 RepID=UPI002CFA395D|nr:ATP-binding protein [Puia sp.]HVU94128.1 ATP-binding protein [Puia sp.]